MDGAGQRCPCPDEPARRGSMSTGSIFAAMNPTEVFTGHQPELLAGTPARHGHDRTGRVIAFRAHQHGLVSFPHVVALEIELQARIALHYQPERLSDQLTSLVQGHLLYRSVSRRKTLT